MPKSKICLPDINVWLAFVAEAHVHHLATAGWMAGLDRRQAAFCRITQMGLLRLLTNATVMGAAPLSQEQAWGVYLALRKDERVVFLAEPDGIEDAWRRRTVAKSPARHLWTDAYLAAFAELSETRLVTFDRKLARDAFAELLAG
jgi:toxin-antitoxin system PIN domain toxin